MNDIFSKPNFGKELAISESHRLKPHLIQTDDFPLMYLHVLKYLNKLSWNVFFFFSSTQIHIKKKKKFFVLSLVFLFQPKIIVKQSLYNQSTYSLNK